MYVAVFSETSVPVYQNTWRYVMEDSTGQVTYQLQLIVSKICLFYFHVLFMGMEVRAKVLPVLLMKLHSRVQVWLHALLTLALVGGERSASRFSRFIPKMTCQCP
jgi:hypothetical protein